MKHTGTSLMAEVRKHLFYTAYANEKQKKIQIMKAVELYE